MTFTNKIIWITGASSGIGKAIALQLAEQNCKLILSSRRTSDLQEVRLLCANPKNIEILPFDLADYLQMKPIVKEAISKFGKVDILINNGGVSQRSLIIETDISVDKKLVEVNYLGTIALSKALLPHFVSNQSGHFVTVSSLMGKFSSPYRSSYCGAKHALHGFFDSLRLEHDKDQIKVTMICPGFVNTDVARNSLTGDGSLQKTQDNATDNGMDVNLFAQKMLKAIEKEKFEAYIGKSETLGIYLKRFFPKLLHKLILKREVR
ncbi:short-subunit dehydrogenase [Winogradskyella epiphytica]|uniref:Short-subunit dehydrogenase n=1 Tax=Winogradskyella epiphytica TaxID=262005 RepID=A0A2V4XT71_9FLAO|nr:SDR family oxidoreductase [Winogradskyella epiphytica]PYE81561.1 short-subunit dehydrogenase [Winogradskyella epiphytica]GGW64261.1 oxidoreductase [Winogradskyella epiphytica]